MAEVLVEKTVGAYEVTFWVITNKAGVNGLCAEGLEQAVGGASLVDLGLLSVAKWETIVEGYDAGAARIFDGAWRTCAFCRRFSDEEEYPSCLGCPIGAYTEQPQCWGTPYWDYRRELAEPDATPEALKAAAQEELEFVKEVVAWVIESNYKEPSDEIPF